MASRSPTLEGFRVMLTRPSFGMAEIAWRWSFGATVVLLVAFSFFEYLDTLPISRGDLLFLKTRQPALVSEAMAHIFRGSGLRLVEVSIVLAIFLTLGWISLASLARAATIRALLTHLHDWNTTFPAEPARTRLGSLFGLNFFHVAITVAAVVGCLAAWLMGGAASSSSNPSPVVAFFIFLAVASLVWLVWSVLNWFLSLASLMVVAGGQDAFGAIGASVTLCRNRPGSIFAASTWFGLAHLAAWVIATSVIAFPLAFARVLPGGMVLGGMLLVTLSYFAVADFLHIGRLASYLAVFSLPDAPASGSTEGRISSVKIRNHESVDPDELILSDRSPQGSCGTDFTRAR